jgi:hypothetical protein
MLSYTCIGYHDKQLRQATEQNSSLRVSHCSTTELKKYNLVHSVRQCCSDFCSRRVVTLFTSRPILGACNYETHLQKHYISLSRAFPRHLVHLIYVRTLHAKSQNFLSLLTSPHTSSMTTSRKQAESYTTARAAKRREHGATLKD